MAYTNKSKQTSPNPLGRWPMGQASFVRRGMPKQDTSWQTIARPYGKLVHEEGSYQQDIIYPGAMKMLNPKAGKSYLDIACGEGAFAELLAEKGALVAAFDLSAGLIKRAESKRLRNTTLRVGNAKDFARYYEGQQFDGGVCILALQNIDNISPVFGDAGKLMKKGAEFVCVLNHPMFRVPRQTGWGFDESKSMQYRRVDGYMTTREIPILANPSKGRESQHTFSYHRSFSEYVQAAAKAGFMLAAAEEWVSGKVSDSGPRAKAENRIRAEIPLFMALKFVKIS